MSKQAIIYCRFSPRPNADECKSNEKQEARCRAYCAAHDYGIVGVLSDVAVSGKSLHRPGLSEALSALEPGMILVVDTSDRLARDMLVSLTIRYQVDKAGCTIEFADGSPLTCTPEGELFQNILAAFAAYERARFARRTKDGLAKKKENGEWLGRPPIGWKIDPAGTKRLVRDEQEQAAIHKARDLSEHGWSSEVIADLLTQSCGLCRGRPWSARTVRKLLAKFPV